MKKLSLLGVLASVFTLVFAAHASAHVVVKPGEVLTGVFEVFTVSVPNERDVANTEIKIEIPDKLQFVTPTVKDGWAINTEKDGSGEEAKTKSITWSGGSIPSGYRDDFTFSAKVPEEPSELHWNAFQTYEDGVVISWNLEESKQPKKADGSPDFSTSGPFSITKVKSSTASTSLNNAQQQTNSDAKDKATTALTMSYFAVALSLVALFSATRNRKRS